MANWMKRIGNFQAGVGRISGDFGLMMSYIVGGIFILIAIVMSILAFIPMKPIFCDEHFDDCNKKVQHFEFLWSLLLIPLAILIIFINRWWDKMVHTNKTAAQIGGTMVEMQTIKDIFSPTPAPSASQFVPPSNF